MPNWYDEPTRRRLPGSGENYHERPEDADRPDAERGVERAAWQHERR